MITPIKTSSKENGAQSDEQYDSLFGQRLDQGGVGGLKVDLSSLKGGNNNEFFFSQEKYSSYLENDERINDNCLGEEEEEKSLNKL